jgi:hypothetical protein
MKDLIGSAALQISETSWHRYAYSPRSSQRLLIESFSKVAYDELFKFLGISGKEIKFEQIYGKTHFDCIVYDSKGSPLATVEAKFMEEGMNHCNYAPKKCSGKWPDKNFKSGCNFADKQKILGKRYWKALHDFFSVQIDSFPKEQIPCPLYEKYQIVHNLAETRRIANCGFWILFYDSRNPYFSEQRLINLLPQSINSSVQIKTISWQSFFKKFKNVELLRNLAFKHGFL